MTVGILALQGSFHEHDAIFRRLDIPTQHVRDVQHLQLIDRLIIPGGESTTIGKLLVAYHLRDAIRQRAHEGMPIWGTCAGAILLAHHIIGGLENQPILDLMDMVIHRNAFGRQLQSFETSLSIPVLGDEPMRGVFIRAPRITAVGESVTILSRLPDDQSIVAAQAQQLLATTFHPELTDDDRFHRYFLTL